MNTILFILACMSFIGAFVVFWFGLKLNSVYKEALILWLVMFLVVLGIWLTVARDKRINFYAAVDAGYTLLVDGQEVEPENLDLERYYAQAHIYDDNQVIVITT